jgi:hypothetical protein
MKSPYVQRQKLKESLEKDGLDMQIFTRGQYYPTLLVCGPRGAGKSTIVAEILQGKKPVIHVTLSEDKSVDELVSEIMYRMGIRVLPPGVTNKGILESVFNELQKEGNVPILLIEVNAQYSSSALQELLVKLKTWGNDKRYIQSVVVLSSSRAALTLSIGLDELRVRCLFVPDLNKLEVNNFVKQMLNEYKSDAQLTKEEVIEEVVPIMDTRLSILNDLSSKVETCESLGKARQVIIEDTELRKKRFLASATNFLDKIKMCSDTENVITVFKRLLNDDMELAEFSSLMKLTEGTLLDIIADIHPHPFYVCPMTRKVSLASPIMKLALNEYLIEREKI